MRVGASMKTGEVFATFHDPAVSLNRITSPHRDRFVMAPEYKVTAVQVMPVAQPSSWQREYSEFNTTQLNLLAQARKKPAEVVGN